MRSLNSWLIDTVSGKKGMSWRLPPPWTATARLVRRLAVELLPSCHRWQSELAVKPHLDVTLSQTSIKSFPRGLSRSSRKFWMALNLRFHARLTGCMLNTSIAEKVLPFWALLSNIVEAHPNHERDGNNMIMWWSLPSVRILIEWRATHNHMR